MTYAPAADRYEHVSYRRCGASGLDLPVIALGLWQNFGHSTDMETQREIVLRAFDRGVTHLDLANNYGPPPGAAESLMGDMLRRDLNPYRDELVISTKAGYRMWPGPYGEWGSRKYLLSSLDASLRRLGLDYVDVFYSHRFDPRTPLTETIGALASAVSSGRALYAGISSYPAPQVAEAARIAADLGVPLIAHQPSYSLINRWIEQGEPSALKAAAEAGMGTVVFSPLAQGMLTGKYLDGIPEGSRAARGGPLRREFLTEENLERVRNLARIAERRGQSLAQLAIAWVLRDPRVTTALVGASSVAQLENSLAALEHAEFTAAELDEIERFAIDGGVNIWARR